jgi:hypothetical protein
MPENTYRNLCIFHILDGLRDGLSHFSQPSRVALVYAVAPDDPIRIYDPQRLLQDHEPILKEMYLDSGRWRENADGLKNMRRFGQIKVESNLQLAGLISCGGRSVSVFYQMWFTEHHPDMCSTGPTERWLEHAAWLLSHDLASDSTFCTGSSGYVLREYATHAVRDFIVDEINLMLGWDSRIRVYPVLDAVLGISKTREERAWPRGELVFVEPSVLPKIDFLVRFPQDEQPLLENHKHVRKLLLAVEDSKRKLVSDGAVIMGISEAVLPKFRITADFKGRHGFLSLNGGTVCSFSDGSFRSTTQQAKMVELEETLLESDIDPEVVHELFKIVASIVHNAQREEFGCTLVIDLKAPPAEIAGQRLQQPIDLRQHRFLFLAQNLAKADGALHIGADLHLHGFSCLLDGHRVAGEDRSRGARFNSALRFTSGNPDILVIVVSADRPVSVIQEGVELNAQCYWKPVTGLASQPPTIREWLETAGV